jgi:hypothetical protein
MTRDEAIEEFEHRVAGMVLDAWSRNRDGKDNAIFLRRINPAVQALLGQVFDLGYKAAKDDEEKVTKPGKKRELFGKGQKEETSDEV